MHTYAPMLGHINIYMGTCIYLDLCVYICIYVYIYICIDAHHIPVGFQHFAPTAERPLVTHEAPHAPGVDEVPEAQETSARTFV